MTPPEQSAYVRQALLWFLGITLSLWLISFGFTALCGWGLHLTYPRNSVLYNPAARYSDLMDYADKTRRFLAGENLFGIGSPPFNYPATALWFYVFLLGYCSKPVAAYFVLALIPFVVGAFLAYRALAHPVLPKRFVAGFLATALIACYPLWFVLDRANLEVIEWGLLLWAFAAFTQQRYLLTALFLGLGVCAKPFPALLFFLLIDKRRYKETLAGVALAGVLVATALAAVGPTIPAAYRSLAGGWSYYLDTFALGYGSAEIGFDHSLFSVLKQAARFSIGLHQTTTLLAIIRASYIPYLAFCALLTLAVFWLYRALPTINKMFALIILMLLVPPTSFEYTLIHLFFPLVAALTFFVHDAFSTAAPFRLSHMLRILVPCAILLGPLSFLVLGEFTSVAGQIKTATLLYLLFFGATRPMPSSLFHEVPSIRTPAPAASHV